MGALSDERRRYSTGIEVRAGGHPHGTRSRLDRVGLCIAVIYAASGGTQRGDGISGPYTDHRNAFMVPKTHDVQVTSQDHSQVPVARSEGLAEPLRIRFVRVAGGGVSGTLAPYTDPVCGCKLVTTFEGSFTGPNTIEGT
jgi:hypothetical protein